jgi:hypothetical protein
MGSVNSAHRLSVQKIEWLKDTQKYVLITIIPEYKISK